jgi:hypothetical protein
MVVTSVAATQADATDGIGGGDTGEYGEPCGNIEELVSRLFIEDHRGDFKIGSSRRQASTSLLLAARRCSQGVGHAGYTVRSARAESVAIQEPTRSIASRSMSANRAVFRDRSIHSAKERSTT